MVLVEQCPCFYVDNCIGNTEIDTDIFRSKSEHCVPSLHKQQSFYLTNFNIDIIPYLVFIKHAAIERIAESLVICKELSEFKIFLLKLL